MLCSVSRFGLTVAGSAAAQWSSKDKSYGIGADSNEGEKRMAKTILQVNFQYNFPLADLQAMTRKAAEPIAQVDGLLWKIWLLDEDQQTSGGIYLFENERAARAYAEGPILGSLQQHPAISDYSAQLSGTIADLSKITRGPLESRTQ
jgi:hypothetical protein